ncbi:ATP phosphoribosyltransferase regulatory subunit [Paenibacillus gallinarum]|uniref:ATP phosphoribosyltransferase regulatory subunit n=1 Tax=Paenibacillus gallinarum TaxID=2762232 RepID=A0ABR8T5W7_9BACL|nr:ATP phosphoribosyltransferase regulatory subunit [Paenibacillus gallinarum]MBD7971127.1 ATP phosphoribosyltransferase regulatory subunit [Paenibacillus gallinarum]
MTKPKGFEKPAGVRDYLPHVVDKLRRIEHKVLECMSSWGYRQIITPSMEYYDTVGVASSTSDQKLFKLLNNRGTTLVLRSDMTAPIARVVSSMLKDEKLPLRLSYHANVFRAIEEEAGREAEFFQTGVELVGDDSPEADAEVVALAISSLQAAGVASFKIAMGHVGFLNGLLGEIIPGEVDLQEELKAVLLKRDYVGYREKIEGLSLSSEQKERLESILRLRGGKEIGERAESLISSEEARNSVQHLCAVWEVLEAYGVSEHVLIDLTMLGDFSYYTGMTFEGYASELGFPVCSGGRYDKLLKQFGKDIPATGFAIKTNRIIDGVQGIRAEQPLPVLIEYTKEHRVEALSQALQLRTEGRTVVTRLMQRVEDRYHQGVDTNEQGNNCAVSTLQGKYEKVYTYSSPI